MQAESSTRALQAGPLRTALRDLALSIEWHDLRTLHLPDTDWDVIIGHKRREHPLRVVLPLPLHTTSLKPSSLKSIFSSLATLPLAGIPEHLPPLAPSIEDLQARIEAGKTSKKGELAEEPIKPSREALDKPEVNGELDREMIYMAIVTTDSTVVYYKLSKGIKKPADIPDE